MRFSEHLARLGWRRLAVAALVLASAGVAYLYALPRHAHSSGGHGHDHDHGHGMRMLEQTLVRTPGGQPLRLAGLASADPGTPLPETLHGHWTVLFLGYTSCPDVCPTTLQLLAAVAADPRSGIADGSTRVFFLSVDPERDSPQRIQQYLAGFGQRIRGISGSRPALDAFLAQLGGAYEASGTGLDHSTTLFVLDPQGRPAGLLLRPGAPERIVSDLAALRGRT